MREIAGVSQSAVNSRGIASQFADIGAGLFVVKTPKPIRDSALVDVGFNTQSLTNMISYPFLDTLSKVLSEYEIISTWKYENIYIQQILF